MTIPTVILITSNMQNDYFHKFPRRRETLNRYWVGRRESERVLGFNPSKGPFAQLMKFIRSTNRDEKEINKNNYNNVEVHLPLDDDNTTSTSSDIPIHLADNAHEIEHRDNIIHYGEEINTASLRTFSDSENVPHSSDTIPNDSSTHLNAIHVIHMKTTVDPHTDEGRKLISRYGEYCILGSEGEKLCCDLEKDIDLYNNEHILRGSRELSNGCFIDLCNKIQEIYDTKGHRSLNPNHDPSSSAITNEDEELPAVEAVNPLRIAIIGGWTEEDIYHLCYEVKTQTLATEIATCSVLTSSSSSQAHWNALSQIKRILNVTVTRTARELIDWLKEGQIQESSEATSRDSFIKHLQRTYWPEMRWTIGHPPSSFREDIDGEIFAHLYRNSSCISIDVSLAKYCNTILYNVQSFDKGKIREAPTVVKIGPRYEIASEYVAFQRVEDILGNHAPSVRGFLELGDRAGIKYRYTRMSGGKVLRFLDLFEDMSKLQPIWDTIDDIFQNVFGTWYAASHLSSFQLFSYYFDGFTINHGRKIQIVHQDPNYLRQFISYVLIRSGTEEAPHFQTAPDFYAYPPYSLPTIDLPSCYGKPLTIMSIADIFCSNNKSGVSYLRSLPPQKFFAAYAHGDANLENFLLDSRGNVWVIDFYCTESQQHVLRDLSRMWACIMYQVTDLTNDDQFAQALVISEILAELRDLSHSLPPLPTIVTDSHICSIYMILQKISSYAGKLVRDRNVAIQLQMALVAESMRFFLHKTKNIYSKRWALTTASLLLQSILEEEKRVHDITPSIIPLQGVGEVYGQLYVSRCPGNRVVERYLTSTLQSSSSSFSSAIKSIPDPFAIQREMSIPRERTEQKERQIAKGNQSVSPSSTYYKEYENLIESQLSLAKHATSKDSSNHKPQSSDISSADNINMDMDSQLTSEIDLLVSYEITHVVLLINESEFAELGIQRENLRKSFQHYGIRTLDIHLPPGTLQLSIIVAMVKHIISLLCDRNVFSKILLISKSGHIRAGLLAACILCALGMTPDMAIQYVREIRGAQAIGHEGRVRLVHQFDLAWKSELITLLTGSQSMLSGERNNPIWHSALPDKDCHLEDRPLV